MNTFVTTIDLALADKLKHDLEEKGFAFTTPPYTVFSAKKKGISCTLYTSGKLTVQGKDKHDFIAFYLEPEILQNFTYSHPEQYVDLSPHIGIDEAGKGDFFGPLCIAGVYADEAKIRELLQYGIRDSKRIGDVSIQKMAIQIKELCLYSVVKISPKTYNHLYTKFKNLNSLLAWAHATAIENLYKKSGCKDVTIDQFAHQSVVEKAIKTKSLPISLTQRHRGEEDPVVAAASVIARATFLFELEELSKQFQFSFPKGASAEVIKKGKDLVQKHGPEVLEQVAKIHFKTTKEIIHEI